MKYFQVMMSLASMLFAISFLFSLISAINEHYVSQSMFGLKIDKKILTYNSSGVILDLEHEYGQNISNSVKLRINNGRGVTYYQNLQNLNKSSISHKIKLKKSQIKNIFVETQQPIKLKVNGRVLQSSQQSFVGLEGLIKFYSYFFGCSRNLIILATVTGTFDLWMPFLMFIQMFSCLGFWTHEPHVFTKIFNHIFTHKLDIFNFIRIKLTSDSQLFPNSFIASYGFTNRFALNCSGQLSVFLTMIFVITIIKLSSSLVKSERVRLINSKLRPIFNGYTFWMSPRILSLAGLSLRSINQNSDIICKINFAIAITMIVLILVFFAFLVLQIRKINDKLQYLEQSKKQIGLAMRIQQQKQFTFDCLCYPMLYFPAMNLFRIIFTHLCIGFAPDFHYVQYGGPIAAQVFYMMIQISSSGYRLRRDRVLYPILDFLYGSFLLCLIGIGLIYSVGHLQLTINLQKFGFSLLSIITVILICQAVLDIIKLCQKNRQELVEKFTSSKRFQIKNEYYQQTKSQTSQKKSIQALNPKGVSRDKNQQFNQKYSYKDGGKVNYEQSCEKLPKSRQSNKQNNYCKTQQLIGSRKVKKIRDAKYI